MTSELCDGGADEQREKEAPAVSKSSSVSPLSVAASLELPGPWSSPASPVTMSPVCRTVYQRSPSQFVFNQNSIDRSCTFTVSIEGFECAHVRKHSAVFKTLKEKMN